jgi:subtilisin family serine protease
VTESFRADKDLEARHSQHGIFCGEVIHALAPDAEILLANWDADRPDEFLQAVRWARDQGAKILSCSLIMPSWSDAEGGGPVHEKLTRILGDGHRAADLLFFASAGNTAQRHWSGFLHAAADGWHEWVAGYEENELTPWGNDEVSVELCCPAKTHFDVLVDDRTSGKEVTHSASKERDQGCYAIARFWPQLSHRYGVRVRAAGESQAAFHIVALGAWLQYATARGSIPFPADGPSVVAIGAVDQDGHRTLYSSCGPNSSRPKPDLVAPVPFPTFGRDIPFSGTSAAAPQAAALAALWWCQHPDWTAEKVKEAMVHSARDLGPKGHDFETGYGMIALPSAP